MLLCVEAERAVQHADGESTEPFSSSTVCLIQRDFSRVEVAVVLFFFREVSWVEVVSLQRDTEHD